MIEEEIKLKWGVKVVKRGKGRNFHCTFWGNICLMHFSEHRGNRGNGYILYIFVIPPTYRT